MSNKNKPSRRKIKQAVRRVAMLTGITIRQARPLAKDKAFVRNADHFAKAKRCYPVSVGSTPTTVDTDKPFEMTFEFQEQKLPQFTLRPNLVEKAFVNHLMPLPPPMKPIPPEKLKEMMDKLREIIKQSPVTFVQTTPSRIADEMFFVPTPGRRDDSVLQTFLNKQRPQTDPTFTFETPASWKAVDDGWSDLLNDKNFFNEKPKDS